VRCRDVSNDLDFLPAGAARPDNLKTRYTYKVAVDRIYDGDTVFLSFDLGLKTWVRKVPCRLYGIDTPEMRGAERPEGILSRQELGRLCQEYSVDRYDRVGRMTDSLPPTLMAKTRKLRSGDDKAGKYGRWLVTLIGWDWENGRAVNLNDCLISSGHATPYPL
jgi:micrococcal nuclease